jgi:hypothetical protein
MLRSLYLPFATDAVSKITIILCNYVHPSRHFVTAFSECLDCFNGRFEMLAVAVKLCLWVAFDQNPCSSLMFFMSIAL